MDQPLFPLLGKRKAYKMIQRDLEEAEIPYETEDGLADFRSRSSYAYHRATVWTFLAVGRSGAAESASGSEGSQFTALN